jgi:hypothetical protein
MDGSRHARLEPTPCEHAGCGLGLLEPRTPGSVPACLTRPKPLHQAQAGSQRKLAREHRVVDRHDICLEMGRPERSQRTSRSRNTSLDRLSPRAPVAGWRTRRAARPAGRACGRVDRREGARVEPMGTAAGACEKQPRGPGANRNRVSRPVASTRAERVRPPRRPAPPRSAEELTWCSLLMIG